MRKVTIILLPILLFACTKESSIRFELPSVISSGMVLQRDTEVALWGKATPGQTVKIVTSWGVRSKTKSDSKGCWQFKIKTGHAGGPYELAFQTPDTSVTLNNILLGEVWICSGQSNMEMPLLGWPPNDTIQNSAREIANANFPQIRLFSVPRKVAMERSFNCVGNWSECSPESVAGFSATAYFFGKKIHQELGVPVGLIHTSWGGTPAEAWTSSEFLKDFPAYATIADSLKVAKVQYDSMMVWMKTMEMTRIDEKDNTFYQHIDLKGQEIISTDFDDSSWPVMPVPAFWEYSVLPEFDGIVWLRKSFEVPQAFENKELTLHLGPIDDMDVAYLNGKKIGEILQPGFWKKSRDYKIPAGIVKSGNNVLTVCVIDQMGGGGLYGPEDISLSIANKGKSLTLKGDWKYMPVAEIMGNEMYLFSAEKTYAAKPKMSFPVGQNTPTTLFNAMINPLVPFTIKGAIWYQGEANVGRGFEYRTLFPALIKSWRNEWKQGDFPFYYVQIAPWEYGDEPKSAAAEVREAQLMTLSTPNTGMVVTMDIGNPVNIHPCYKEEVGNRLALWALAKNYDYDTLTYSGPLFNSILTDGNKIIVSFNYTNGGLVARGGDLTYFEVAGEDQVYYPAKAQIVDQTVVVTSEQVSNPVAVRYGWSATAEPNLFNGAGLPASPFRSDNWKRLSEY
jgi:sialate O-acetylesterase